MKISIFFSIAVCLFFACSDLALSATTAQTPNSTLAKGIAFLRSRQLPDGRWGGGASGNSPVSEVGPTAVIITGLLKAGVAPSDPIIEKGLEFLKKHVREDGGVYTKDGFFQNYETCLAILAFSTAKNTAKTNTADSIIENAAKYIEGEQFTESKEITPENPFYGGAGYGRHQRPDLSNTQFFIESLRAAGKSADDPAIQKALIFVSRCQNRESEYNTLPFAAKNPDGGFIYTAATQESMAGDTPDGGLRSYASMTYAGLKSMIYAGLSKNDPRVKAAFEWITKHYSLDENPGVGQDGLFYYYQVMAKALSVMEMNELIASDGLRHDWRKEITEKLASKQNADGSWMNTGSSRWMENDPELVTGYVLMVLSESATPGVASR